MRSKRAAGIHLQAWSWVRVELLQVVVIAANTQELQRPEGLNIGQSVLSDK